MTQMHNISLNQFRDFFPDARYIGLGDDFFIMDINLTKDHSPLSHPCRFDGYMVIYCLEGHIRLNVNLEEHVLKSGMLFVNYPGNIIRVNELVESRLEDLHYICVAMSRGFVSNLMVDVNKIFTQNLSLIEQPSIELDDKQRELLREHIALMVQVMKDNPTFSSESIKSILSSVFYLMAGVWAEKVAVNNDKVSAVSSRSRAVFESFIKMVSEYHAAYRNVGFYADKMCITPKYLSRIIRDATGRSAPEWIDAYVILEAKNLLKYSGLAIKEIVYRLNFPNQSVFYKFFKARTGMTPTEYRNS